MSSESIGTIFPLLLIVLAFWFLVIRPARKRQQDMARIQGSVSVGSEVMLASGIYGTVVSIGEETLSLAVAPGTQIKVARQAVVRVLDDPGQGPAGGAAAPGEHRPDDPGGR